MRCIFISLLVLLFSPTNAQEVREYIDLQMHPTMHVPYSFFGKGFRSFIPDKEPKLKYKHQFKDVNYSNYWKNNKGARIIVTGALTKEGIKKNEKARRIILEQIQYVNDFALENSEDFVVAKSPREIRTLLQTTEKTIIVHSIEGAKKLIASQEDADFWASQGVAFITLIHLVDSELGSSAIKPGIFTKIINLKGTLKKEKKRVGLTEKGKQTILWLANAGIMTDITHMSDKCRTETLEFMEEHQIPPIATHDGFRPIQNHPRGIPADEVLKIYQNKGFISLPISGESLMPHKPEPAYQEKIDQLDCYCEGSIDSYKFTYQEVKKLIESNHQFIAKNNSVTSEFSELSESEKVNYSIGFQSDFNGWLNHSRPRYGKKGCYEPVEGTTYEPIELDGMPHPGYLESQWRLLEKEGVDLEPIKRNSEKFLQVWEYFLDGKGSFGKS